MITIFKKYLSLCGKDSKQIKKSAAFGFLDGIFESFPFLAIFYLFWKLENVEWQIRELHAKDILIITAILAVGAICRWIMKYYIYHLQGVAGYNAAARARLLVGDRLTKTPMGYFNHTSTGDTLTTMTDDMHYIEKNAAFILEKYVNGCIDILVLSIGMMIFDWRVGLIFLAGQVLSLCVISSMQKKGTQNAVAIKSAQSDINDKLIEYLNGIETSKIYRKSNVKDQLLKDGFYKYGKASYHMEKSFISKNLLFFLVSRTACALISGVTGYLTIGDTAFGIGKAIVLFAATFVVYQPLESFGAIISMIRMLDISMKRIDKMQHLEIMGGGDKTVHQYDFSLEHVSFGYDKNQPVLKDVTLKIPQNAVTAIVGPSGCGKTTLTRILARFWDVDQGKITIGKINVKDISVEKLYSYFSIVFQDVFLFNDTIENNIKIGKPDATHEDIVEAAKKACCHEFIEKLEKGYDTIVGENGNCLSGGERQRISIARAILKDAPVILLDEATASVDPENEWMINKALQELTKQKTVVVIAHKMSTIMDANQIVVMEDGRIHNIGTHDELIGKDSIYQSFWNARKYAEDWQVS